MTDEEIIERLTKVRGIGRWTVEMLLLFELGRLDVWPVADYGVQKGFAKTFGRKKLPTPETVPKDRREVAAVSIGRRVVFLARPRCAKEGNKNEEPVRLTPLWPLGCAKAWELAWSLHGRPHAGG